MGAALGPACSAAGDPPQEARGWQLEPRPLLGASPPITPVPRHPQGGPAPTRLLGTPRASPGPHSCPHFSQRLSSDRPGPWTVQPSVPEDHLLGSVWGRYTVPLRTWESYRPVTCLPGGWGGPLFLPGELGPPPPESIHHHLASWTGIRCWGPTSCRRAPTTSAAGCMTDGTDGGSMAGLPFSLTLGGPRSWGAASLVPGDCSPAGPRLAAHSCLPRLPASPTAGLRHPQSITLGRDCTL